MNTEQKAKAYDEAIKRAEKALEVYGTDKCEGARQIFSLFPELQESEDERIRKGLIKALSSIGKRNWGGIDVFESISWLEKQGEKNPTDEEMKTILRTEYEKGKADAIAETQKEWSEDDEKRLQSCINILKAKSLMGKVDTANTMWLKSLKQRIGG